MRPNLSVNSDLNSRYVVTTGDGVTTEQILTAIHVMWSGGARIYEDAAKVVCGKSSIGFYQTWRSSLEPGTNATMRDLLEYQQGSPLTYEIGLRWFLINMKGQRNRRGGDEVIMVLPANPMVINGQPQILVFIPGGDGPGIDLRPFSYDDPVSCHFVETNESTPGAEPAPRAPETLRSEQRPHHEEPHWPSRCGSSFSCYTFPICLRLRPVSVLCET